jgi:pyruvate dehydrogenase E1 component alpha subunit
VTETAASLPVTRAAGLALLRDMLRIRCFEDRCAELYGKMKIRGFLHLYNGEEAVAAGAMSALRPDDAVVTTYREHGHAIVRGIPMTKLMAELYGKVSGCCRGRGGSMHIFDAATRFYGGNAIVGGSLPLAVGIGLAEKLRNRSSIAACFFGEGAVAEGEFHESLNLSALWKLPVLFLCENNGYAMGTALARSESQTDIHAKAASYGIRSVAVDGMDVVAVEAASREAAEFVRTQRVPMFIEFRTYRFRAHSMYDPQLYRDRNEVQEWQQRGPLITLTTRLKQLGLMTEADYLELEKQASSEVDAAVEFAERAPLEPVEDLLRFVYAEQPS